MRDAIRHLLVDEREDLFTNTLLDEFDVIEFACDFVITRIAFPEMLHGWMTRGPIDKDEAIARDYALGMRLMIDFFNDKCKV